MTSPRARISAAREEGRAGRSPRLNTRHSEQRRGARLGSPGQEDSAGSVRTSRTGSSAARPRALLTLTTSHALFSVSPSRTFARFQLSALVPHQTPEQCCTVGAHSGATQGRAGACRASLSPAEMEAIGERRCGEGGGGPRGLWVLVTERAFEGGSLTVCVGVCRCLRVCASCCQDIRLGTCPGADARCLPRTLECPGSRSSIREMVRRGICRGCVHRALKLEGSRLQGVEGGRVAGGEGVGREGT